MLYKSLSCEYSRVGWGGGGTPYNALYGEAPPKRWSLRVQVYERVEISLVEVYKRVGKSVIWVCKMT